MSEKMGARGDVLCVHQKKRRICFRIPSVPNPSSLTFGHVLLSVKSRETCVCVFVCVTRRDRTEETFKGGSRYKTTTQVPSLLLMGENS